MKRGKQIFLFLVILFLCGGYAFWRSGLHLSPKAAMEAEERGLRYGPSEEILLTFEKEDGGWIYVGQWEKGLSVICLEEKWGFFWKTASTEEIYSRCLPIEEPVEAFFIGENRIVGFSNLPEVKNVLCYLNGYNEKIHEDIFLKEVAMDTAENGFFSAEIELPESVNWEDVHIGYLEARTEHGDIVFQEGEKEKLTAIPNGAGYMVKDMETEV